MRCTFLPIRDLPPLAGKVVHIDLRTPCCCHSLLCLLEVVNHRSASLFKTLACLSLWAITFEQSSCTRFTRRTYALLKFRGLHRSTDTVKYAITIRGERVAVGLGSWSIFQSVNSTRAFSVRPPPVSLCSSRHCRQHVQLSIPSSRPRRSCGSSNEQTRRTGCIREADVGPHTRQ